MQGKHSYRTCVQNSGPNSHTHTLRVFYHRLQAVVWHCKFHPDSRWDAPDDFSGDFDWFLSFGGRKGQRNVLSHGEGGRGFDKHPASTYVTDIVDEDPILRGARYGHGAPFPGMFSSVAPPPIIQGVQKFFPLVLGRSVNVRTNVSEEILQPNCDTRLIGLLDGVCHGKNRVSGVSGMHTVNHRLSCKATGKYNDERNRHQAGGGHKTRSVLKIMALALILTQSCRAEVGKHERL